MTLVTQTSSPSTAAPATLPTRRCLRSPLRVCRTLCQRAGGSMCPRLFPSYAPSRPQPRIEPKSVSTLTVESINQRGATTTRRCEVGTTADVELASSEDAEAASPATSQLAASATARFDGDREFTDTRI